MELMDAAWMTRADSGNEWMGFQTWMLWTKTNKSNSWPEPQNDKTRQQSMNTTKHASELCMSALGLSIQQNENVVS